MTSELSEPSINLRLVELGAEAQYARERYRVDARRRNERADAIHDQRAQQEEQPLSQLREAGHLAEGRDRRSGCSGDGRMFVGQRKESFAVNLGEIFDLVGIRVVVDRVEDCYAALGSIHATWKPVQGRFKDYIAMPKFNLYQSLHTTVVGPQGKPIEVQIRTKEMHQRAEYGIAAHWRYKETKGTHNGKSVEIDEMAWMRQLLDWQREAADPGEFLEGLRWDLAAREIFVFTPKGDVETLPTGSTPVASSTSTSPTYRRSCTRQPDVSRSSGGPPRCRTRWPGRRSPRWPRRRTRLWRG